MVRFPEDEKDALDRLRARYFDETKQRISRAAIVRILLRRALAGADERKAVDVLREGQARSSRSHGSTNEERGRDGDREPPVAGS
jgi:hypothetical protein